MAADLARLEERFSADLTGDPDAAAEPMADLFASGGKRLRPGLVLLCAALGDYDFERVAPAAMAVEYTHASTLLHDDVIDRSATRRGRPTLFELQGAPAGILVGDFYFAKAYHEAAACGRVEVVSLLSRAVMVICEGELEQQAARHRYRPTELEYMARIEKKTACLLSAACAMGALLGGLDIGGQGALRTYGTHLGLAFQIADDVLDYTSDARELGKPVAHDLLEGSATLPLMLAVADPGVGPELEELLPEGRSLTATQVARVADLVRSCGAPALALARAAEIVAHACSQLRTFGSAPAAKALAELADYVVSRTG